MALWRDAEIETSLMAQGIRLSAPTLEDYENWAKLRGASRSHTEPWEPAWTVDELSRSAFKRRLERYQIDRQSGAGYPFFVFRSRDNVLLGACNLNNVRRGVQQSADIGYWIGTPYIRQGHTRMAVRRIMAFAFDNLGLHRVEAACRPENRASRKLLKSIGFQFEGRARAFLNIAGEWRDHDRFALLNTDPRL
ncbi:GNAT family N-acetyltransferase [Maricaulis salignorans]|uniref:Ribosomal-protein-alanine N-acetyltransferase n=1 Tax=Maricaulis salignorans TaxID=144026 RepID=A0A1G9RHA7_9PROT|nr:GNAT family protein [Maricaulis salignorans]SDM22626.1 ribosomal-protein-alanine N-acetyltransferase [Maricaulis salignorans]